MSDLAEWIKERRRIHDAATGGPWEAAGATVATAWSGGWDDDGPIDDREQVTSAAPEDVESIVDAHNTLPALLTAVEKVLELHTRVVTDQHIDGPTAVCEQCSEDRMFQLWPCETVLSVQSAIEGGSDE